MERYGFPPRDCHVDEHERVLASVREVCSLVAAGDVAAGRGLAPALADWFPGHSDYMDAALATWVMKKVANGAPVPLRRVMRGITSIAGHAGEPGVRVEAEVDTGDTPCQ
jgi:hemerythrin